MLGCTHDLMKSIEKETMINERQIRMQSKLTFWLVMLFGLGSSCVLVRHVLVQTRDHGVWVCHVLSDPWIVTVWAHNVTL